MLHGTQLSLIQLGGGVAVGVFTERGKDYSSLLVGKTGVFEWSSLIVWTITQVCSNYLMTSLADVEYWERPLRYHYCSVHDILCRSLENFPSSEEQSNLISCSQLQLLRYDPAIKQTKIIVKKVVLLTIETGSLTGTDSIECLQYVAEYFHLSRHWNHIFFTSSVSE